MNIEQLKQTEDGEGKRRHKKENDFEEEGNIPMLRHHKTLGPPQVGREATESQFDEDRGKYW